MTKGTATAEEVANPSVTDGQHALIDSDCASLIRGTVEDGYVRAQANMIPTNNHEELSNDEIAYLRSLLRKAEAKQMSAIDSTASSSSTSAATANPGSATTTTQSRSISCDTFSFLLDSSSSCQSQILAYAVFLLQVLVFVCIFLDSLFLDFTENDSTIRTDDDAFLKPARLRLPWCVNPVVRIIQVITMCLALLNQEDLRTSFCMWDDGFVVAAASCFSSRWRWHVSVACRALVGFMAFVTSTVLIFYSHTVLDVILNFLAVEAVSYVDNVIFEWTLLGFFGARMQEDSKRISEQSYNIVTKPGQRNVKALCMLGTFGAILATWVAMVIYLSNIEKEEGYCNTD